MAEVTVTVDARELTKLLAGLKYEFARKATARALNDAVRAVRTDTVKEIRKDYMIKARDLKSDAMRIKSARPNSTPEATLTIRGARIPLSRFGNPKPSNRGVRVTVRKGRRQLYKRSFLATVKGPNEEIYWRVKDGSGGLVPRGPLQILLGPSIVQIAGAPKRRAKMLALALESIRKNLKSQADRFRAGS